MKIVITGATGFVGRNLAESFHDEGLHIVATGRSQTIGDDLQKRGIEFSKADIRDSGQLNSAFSPADCVIHCAARSGPWGTHREFYEVNVIGTRNVIEACKKHEIDKIIFMSTPSLYLTNQDRYDISESDPLPAKQVSSYGETKLINETELLNLAKEGYKVIMFRPRALYGPYDNTMMPRILRLAEKKQMPLINKGAALVDITYIDNLTEAVRKCFVAPDSAWNEAYNISNGDPITIKDWFSQMLQVFNRPFKPKNVPESVAKVVAGTMEFVGHLPFINKEPPMTRYSVAYMAKSMTMSIDKAKTKLSYHPLISNRQGFEEYAEWYNSREKEKD